MRSRHSSASSCCESGVEPTRSQKSTVSWRRSPAAVSGAGSGSPPGVETALARASVVSRAPQPPQNCSSGWFEAPHDAQGAASAAPHFPQNRRSARLSWLQDGQRIAACFAPGDYHAGRKPRNSPPGESSAGRNQGIQPRRPPSGPGHGAIRQAPTSQLNPSRRPEPDPQLLPIPPGELPEQTVNNSFPASYVPPPPCAAAYLLCRPSLY